METKKMYEVHVSRDDKRVATFWTQTKNETVELRLAFSCENEKVDILDPELEEKPWSPYDGITEAEKQQAHQAQAQAQAQQMMRDGA